MELLYSGILFSLPYSRLFTRSATFADVFSLPWAGYFHRCIVRDRYIDEFTLFAQLVKRLLIFKYYYKWFYFGESRTICQIRKAYLLYGMTVPVHIYKIYSQLPILGMLSVYLCARERLKDNDIVACIVAGFFSTHMHICWVGIYFHEIVLPHEKAKSSTPHKKLAIWYVSMYVV